MSDSNHSLRDLVRQVIADHPDADPVELAEFVAKLADQEQLRSYLAEALVHVVREVLGSERREAMDGLTKPKNRSAKREQIKSWWAELCASRVSVGDSWKSLGECTVDDLNVCVDERRTHIARVQAQITNYQHLIDLMVKNGARTVADLPEQKSWEGKK